MFDEFLCLNIYNTKVCVYKGTDNNGDAYSYETIVTTDGEFLFVVDGEYIIPTGPIGNAAEGELAAEFANFAEAESSGEIPAPPTGGGSRVRAPHKTRRRRAGLIPA